MPLTPAIIADAMKAVCRDEPVRLAYLFGSYAWGVPDRESDIDIAVLADPKLTKEERWSLHLHLMGAFAEALGVSDERVDIVILEDAPPLLKYNAVFKGVCAFARDRSERNLFVGELGQRLIEAKKFRNVLVHMYAEIDPPQVYRNLREGYNDLQEFARAMAGWLKEHDGGRAT